MKKMIAALQVSLDGFIEGPNGELDWIPEWSEDFDILKEVDTCVLGGGMYPGYEKYWMSILANPEAVLELTGRKATKGEVDYAYFADRTPHFVLSTTLENAAWKTTTIVQHIDDVKKLKQQTGKNIYVIGGANMVSNLVNDNQIDELRLVIHPVILGKGKALFKEVKNLHRLKLISSKATESGQVSVIYTFAQ